jgi:hypothetical protein
MSVNDSSVPLPSRASASTPGSEYEILPPSPGPLLPSGPGDAFNSIILTNLNSGATGIYRSFSPSISIFYFPIPIFQLILLHPPSKRCRPLGRVSSIDPDYPSSRMCILSRRSSGNSQPTRLYQNSLRRRYVLYSSSRRLVGGSV